VRENLEIAVKRGPAGAPAQWTVERIYELFPVLAPLDARLGGYLSGGEQQMLTIGRALLTNPSLLILDEATEGLAPLIRAEIWRCLASLKESGLSILVIDKNVGALLRVADRHFLIERGRVVMKGPARQVLESAHLREAYLGAHASKGTQSVTGRLFMSAQQTTAVAIASGGRVGAA